MIDARIKIHKRFLFTSGQLLNYLKTVKKFDKLDLEILATVTYKTVYKKLLKDRLISFPYRENREKEINKRSFLKAEEIGDFIRKNIEEYSPIDSILVDPLNQRSALVRPLQIKFIGKGEYANFKNDGFIKFLKKLFRYEKNNYTLVIVTEGLFSINIQEIINWLGSNNFPFKEVVLINPNNVTGDMEFYPLKNSYNDFKTLKIKNEEMLKDF